MISHTINQKKQNPHMIKVNYKIKLDLAKYQHILIIQKIKCIKNGSFQWVRI